MIGRIGRNWNWEEWELGGMDIGNNGNWEEWEWEMEELRRKLGERARIHIQLSKMLKITSVSLLIPPRAFFTPVNHGITTIGLLTRPWLEHLLMTDYTVQCTLYSAQHLSKFPNLNLP